MQNRNETSSMSYFVVCMEYGRGREAIVNPETTRRGVIDLIVTGELPADQISFIHHITMNDVPQDVTAELIALAEAESGHRTFDRPDAADAQAARFDHARDLRKHSAVA